jgi:hypothetical protein
MELSLTSHSYLGGAFTYADIAFYMAQFFAARHTVPMTASYSNLLAWRSRVAQRRAVKPVIGAMADYLHSLSCPSQTSASARILAEPKGLLSARHLQTAGRDAWGKRWMDRCINPRPNPDARSQGRPKRLVPRF